ncbi:MAG: hypothetical protein B7O98_03650 [Zestosphaera tikiterensis]|uniref:Phosphate transport regulator n=1 Tax=Zestosphaera tikiterensis TaxID=1973259 RepID=A0A2R7Y7L9_9CREN|nr:MAG: hypothetical protein B7O98_03650 [Zestosphaera tikiterensis]
MEACSFEADLANDIVKYSSLVVSIVSKVTEGIKMLESLRSGEAMEKFAEAIHEDTVADNLRRELLLKLQYLHPGFMRERVSTLLRRLDLISEQAKDVARNLTIFPYLELPAELKKSIETLAEESLKSSTKVFESIKALLNNSFDDAIKLAYQAELIEEEADNTLVEGRRYIVKYGSLIKNPAILIMASKLIESLEGISDFAEDVGDYVRALALYCKGVLSK